MFTYCDRRRRCLYFSIVAIFFPDIFPDSFRDASGQVGVYYEAAAVIVTLVLLGQVLELKARSQTSIELCLSSHHQPQDVDENGEEVSLA